MILPVLALFASATRSFSGFRREIMNRQREVLESKYDLATEFRLQSLYVRVHPLAIRALIIGEFDECNGSIFRSTHRSVADPRTGASPTCTSVRGGARATVADCCSRRVLRYAVRVLAVRCLRKPSIIWSRTAS